jgi:putative spermidine/putrescine transport system ATP-binding protein
MSFFEIQNLSKQYAGRPVFSNLDLSIGSGEFITLLGPSGCGKSTLLRCMAGLSRPDQGSLHMAGQEITHLAPQKRGIGMVFQSYALFPNMTVAQNIAFGLRMQGLPQPEQQQAVSEMIELVELTGREQAMPDELSGGQKQRVALARALVVRPRLLLLDEPLSALDARIRRHLREQIRAIQQRLGLTTVFVTHDQEEALTLSDRIVLMHEGQIVQAGSAEDLYTRPTSRFAAQFIGQYNLLTAPEALTLLGRPITGQMAIRPESITLEPAAASALTGRVLDHQLLGNVIRYRIECRGIQLKVDALNRDAGTLLPPGTTIGLRFAEPELCEVA